MATAVRHAVWMRPAGRFACQNCCCEDFQGVDLSSPRYSWTDFYSEQDWAALGLHAAQHHPGAKERGYVHLDAPLASEEPRTVLRPPAVLS